MKFLLLKQEAEKFCVILDFGAGSFNDGLVATQDRSVEMISGATDPRT
jgi:hypothetical protein